jgi:hypothetical protein
MGLVQAKVGDGPRNGWQFDHLMGVVQRGEAKRTMATGTRRRIHVLHVRRLQQGRSSPRMSLACPPFARGGTPCGLCERRVGRWRLTGGFGGFIQPPLQRIDLPLELVLLLLQRVQLGLERQHMGLDRIRGLLPCLWRKGKRPGRVVGVRLRCQCHSPPGLPTALGAVRFSLSAWEAQKTRTA